MNPSKLLLRYKLIVSLLSIFVITAVVIWRTHYFKPFSRQDCFAINSATVTLPSVKYLLLVFSEVGRYDQRMGLRSDTGFIGYPWTDERGKVLEFTHLFVVGTGSNEDDVSRYVFERERAKYKDIIELPVGDREQLLWALKEVDKLYHFEYLIKVQDTTLVNVRYMYEWFQDRRFSYGGACVEGVKVPKSVPSSLDSDSSDVVLNYAHSSFIALSWDMLGCLNAYVKSGPRRVFQADDVLVGTLISDLEVDVICIPGAFAGQAEANCLSGTALSLQNVTAPMAAKMLMNWKRTGSYCPRII